MIKDIWINGIKSTEIFGPSGYEVTYEKVTGPNSGTMQGGLEVEDVIAKRAVVTLPMMPITEEQASAFIGNVYGHQYATVKFFDLKTRDYITKSCIYEEIKSKHLLTSVDGHDYWYCGTFVFRDREGETWDS